MLLENKYYRWVSQTIEGENALFRVHLLPECEVYRGHFPGNPVCPGICNVELIKECAMRLAGKNLRIKTLIQCRLTALASPTSCQEFDVHIQALSTENGFQVRAMIMDAVKKYVDFKGELIVLET